MATRLKADTGLSPAEKTTVLAKVEARDSATESARIATVIAERRKAAAVRREVRDLIRVLQEL